MIDKVDKCRVYTRPAKTRKKDPTRIVVHRIGPALNGVTVRAAEDVAAFYGQNPQYTGGKPAYHAVVTADGEVEISERDTKICMHAVGYNGESLGIAVVGDFRKAKIRPHQYAALLQWCVDKCRAYGIQPGRVSGHTDLPGATNTPGKICPGKGIDIQQLREDILDELRA